MRRGRVRKGTSSRSGAGLVGASAAAVAKAAAREAERVAKEERHAQLAAERAAEKERKRAEEEAERRFWACPEELEMTPERKAMLKILQELFHSRHAAFNQAFICPTGGGGDDAADDGAADDGAADDGAAEGGAAAGGAAAGGAAGAQTGVERLYGGMLSIRVR